MITLEWVKTIAENLRLGLYKPESVTFHPGGEVTIKDIDSNVQIKLHVFPNVIYEAHSYSKNWFGKEIKKKDPNYPKHYMHVTVYTTNLERSQIPIVGGSTWTKVFEEFKDEDYYFWSDFKTWIMATRKSLEMQLELKALEAFTL